MPFKKGQRHPNQGGSHGGGRPTREEAAINRLVALKVGEIIGKAAPKIATHYVRRALSKNGDRVLTHLIERIIPPAKQEVAISGGLQIVEVTTNVKE